MNLEEKLSSYFATLMNEVDEIILAHEKIISFGEKLLSPETYANTVAELTSDLKLIGGKCMLTKVATKRYFVTIIDLYNLYISVLLNIIRHKNEKDACGTSPNYGVLEDPNLDTIYYDFEFPENILSITIDSLKINILRKNIIECGSLDNLLGEKLDELRKNITLMTAVVKSNTNVVSSSYMESVLTNIHNIKSTILSESVIDSIHNKGTEMDTSTSIMCHLTEDCQSNISLLNVIKNYIKHINDVVNYTIDDCKILEKAIAQYVKTEFVI